MSNMLRKTYFLPLFIVMALTLAACDGGGGGTGKPDEGPNDGAVVIPPVGTPPIELVPPAGGETVPILPDGSELNLEDCEDGIDNNGNGLVDCRDPACATNVVCISEPPAETGPSGTIPGETGSGETGTTGPGEVTPPVVGTLSGIAAIPGASRLQGELGGQAGQIGEAVSETASGGQAGSPIPGVDAGQIAGALEGGEGQPDQPAHPSVPVPAGTASGVTVPGSVGQLAEVLSGREGPSGIPGVDADQIAGELEGNESPGEATVPIPGGVITPPIPGGPPQMGGEAGTACDPEGRMNLLTEIEVLEGNTRDVMGLATNAMVSGDVGLKIRLYPWINGKKVPADSRYSWTWKRDGVVDRSAVRAPTYAFDRSGPHQIELSVVDTECQSNGRNITGTSTVDVVIFPPPEAPCVAMIGTSPVRYVKIVPTIKSGDAVYEPDRVEGDVHYSELIKARAVPYTVKLEALVNDLPYDDKQSGFRFEWTIDGRSPVLLDGTINNNINSPADRAAETIRAGTSQSTGGSTTPLERTAQEVRKGTISRIVSAARGIYTSLTSRTGASRLESVKKDIVKDTISALIPKEEELPNTITQTFRDRGVHQIAVTVTDTCGVEYYDTIRASFVGAEEETYSDSEPNWRTFGTGAAGTDAALAMSDKRAVIVKTGGNDRVYYRIFDLEHNRFPSGWVRFSSLPASCTYSHPSVGMIGNFRFIVALQKTCNNVPNVIFKNFQGLTDGSYQEQPVQYLGKSGKKWSPLVMVKKGSSDYAIAWINETENRRLPEPDFSGDYDRYRILREIFIIIFLEGGQTVRPQHVYARDHGEGFGHIKKPKYTSTTLTRLLESRLKGTVLGDGYCMAFRRVEKNYFGQRILSDTNEMRCLDRNGNIAFQTSADFSLDTPALSSAVLPSGKALVAVQPSDAGLTFKIWLNNSLKTYYLHGMNEYGWPDTIGSIAAVNAAGALEVALSNVSHDKVLLTSLPVLNATTDFMTMRYEYPAGAVGELADAQYAASPNGNVMAVWIKGGKIYAIKGPAIQ